MTAAAVDTATQYNPPTVEAAHPQNWPVDRVAVGYHHGGWAAMFVLNTRTGVFAAEPNTSRIPAEKNPVPFYDQHRDLWVQTWQWDRTPTWIGWFADSALSPGSYLRDPDLVRELLDLLTPSAQDLLNALTPVPGTNDWDWSLRATALYERIGSIVRAYNPLTDAEHRAETVAKLTAPLPDRHHYGVVTLPEVLEVAPTMANPTWAVMSDAELDAVAAKWRADSFMIPWNVEVQIAERYHDWEMDRGHLPIYVVGVRADLREWRRQAAQTRTGLPVVDASKTDLPVPETFSADIDDEQLVRIAAEIEARMAQTDAVCLVGVESELRRRRARLRTLVRQEAAAVAERTAQAEESLRKLRATRAGLLARIVGWGESPEWGDDGEPDYAEIGRLGRMTRQGARSMVSAWSLVDPAVRDGETDGPGQDSERC